jgi:hypothetical protein
VCSAEDYYLKYMIDPRIDFRQLNYSNRNEVFNFYDIFWRIPVDVGDDFILEKTPEFIEECAENAIATENETNTFSGIALFHQKL